GLFSAAHLAHSAGVCSRDSRPDDHLPGADGPVRTPQAPGAHHVSDLALRVGHWSYNLLPALPLALDASVSSWRAGGVSPLVGEMQIKQRTSARRLSRLLSLLALAICGFGLMAATARACPMCSQSIAEEDLLPHAYMYSILFMLGMPAM